MRSQRWWIAVVAIIAALVLWAPPDRALDDLAVPDGEEYAITAYNLSELHRYSFDLDGESHPPRYPFGYPLTVAAVNAASGARLANAVYLNIGLGVLMVCLVSASAAMVAPGGASLAGLLAAALLLSSTIFFTAAHWVMSEALLMFLFLAHAHGAARAVGDKRPAAWAFVAGLAVGYAGATRLTALVLVLPALLCLLAWTPSRRRLRALLAYAGGTAFVAVPLLLYNARTFGSPLRSGYQYWCSNPYDLLSNTFSFEAMLREQRWWFYLRELHHQLWESAAPAALGRVAGLTAVLAAVVVLTFYAGIASLARARDRRSTAWLVIALSTIAATLVQYALYFIVSERFLVPVLPLCCVVLGVGVAALGGARRRVIAAVFAVAWLVVFAARIESVAHERARFVEAPPSATERFMRQADERLEPDAIIISNKSPLLVGHYLLRGNQRRYVPYSRGIEYASKYAQPAPPIDPSRIPAGKPFDHLYEGALENGGHRVFAQTFTDDRAALFAGADGRAIYLLRDARGNAPLPPDLTADEVVVVEPFYLLRIR